MVIRVKDQNELNVERNGDLEPLLDVRKVAKILGLREKTLRDWVWRKKIDYVKCGDRVMFEPERIRRFISRSRVRAKDES